jgi:hypothetical protein
MIFHIRLENNTVNFYNIKLLALKTVKYGENIKKMFRYQCISAILIDAQ